MRIRIIAAGALAAGALAAAPSGAAHADTPYDPALAAAAAGWIDGQLQDGLLPSSYGGANYGASADAILGLVASGHVDEAKTMATALEGRIDSYISGDDEDPTDDADAGTTYEDPGSTYAGSTAKAAVALADAGIDPATVTTHLGGQPAGDLISRLEATVQSSGRIQDTSTYGDYENSLGQAYAAGALTAAGSSDAPKVTSFLLTQQCSDGWFRLSFTADDSCDADADSSPSVDATAVALLELAPQASDDTVGAAIDKAMQWLESQQKAGAWTDGTTTGTPNVNSTGLAGWALGTLGDTARAEQAAAWVRARQLTNLATCTPYAKADLGALAYDPAAWKKAQAKAVGKADDQFVVGTAQAVGVLQWAPARPATSGGTAGATSYVKGGSTQYQRITGLAPGAPACGHTKAADNLVASGVAGAVRVPLTMPARTGRITATVSYAGGRSTTHYNVLGKATLKPSLSRARAPKGSKVVVTVKHLAKGEVTTVKLRGKKVATGNANHRGIFRKAFKVVGKPGRAVVTVRGQFASRHGSTTLRVVR